MANKVDKTSPEQRGGDFIERLRDALIGVDLVIEGAEDGGDALLLLDGWDGDGNPN